MATYTRNEENYTRGTSVEVLFKERLEYYFETKTHHSHPVFREATRNENMFDHIDWFVSYTSTSTENAGPKVVTVDVKAPRNGKYYIETKNVNGDPGSLFGKADVLAIYNELNSTFLMVDRAALAGYVTTNYDNTRIFQWRTRDYQGKRDEFAQVSYDLLKQFAFQEETI